ncbi:helix-turn-helix domain-containing protein [Nakamurella sp. YIM 132087]|uniref:Helix-turn-helix domain-containing protein n=2 Tax=Nakamurella alba TaxID=2665158 RepID=A0A7K1FE29_9ACTN|nr:helix-turn-helix domain-containing protein [Nakamurella alba]
MSGPVRAPAVLRAMAVLEQLEGASARHPLSLAALAARLGVPKSSLLSICNSLVDARLVRRTEGGYSLGHRVVELSSSYLQSLDEVHEFYSVCRALVPDPADTIHLASFAGPLDITYLARRDGSTMPVVSPIGRSLPASCSATGKSLLAQLSESELDARLGAVDRLPAVTENSITAPDELRRHLKIVRDNGFGVDDEETTPGLLCVGMAVPAARGAQWAVGITMLKARSGHEGLPAAVDVLRSVTSEMARRLGS